MVHETSALRYWRKLLSTLSVIGAEPVTFDLAYSLWTSREDIDESAQLIAEKQRANSAPSKAESWGRR